MIDLPALRKLLQDGTPGPWEADLDRFTEADGIEAIVCDPKTDMLVKIGTDITEYSDDAWARARQGQELRNAKLIAAAVNSLEPLLAVYEAALALVDEARAETDPFAQWRSEYVADMLGPLIDRARNGGGK